MSADRRLIVAATGASGMPVLRACLQIIHDTPGWQAVLIASSSAKLTYEQEIGSPCDELSLLASETLSNEAIGAGPASGSWPAAGMLVVPCSMKTLAGIHAGYAENLIQRAADVTVKEHRPLVLGVRECPLSPIHLRNMQELSMLPSVWIMPLVMEFYTRPESLEDMTVQVAARLLQPFGICADGYQRWQGIEAAA